VTVVHRRRNAPGYRPSVSMDSVRLGRSCTYGDASPMEESTGSLLGAMHELDYASIADTGDDRWAEATVRMEAVQVMGTATANSMGNIALV